MKKIETITIAKQQSFNLTAQGVLLTFIAVAILQSIAGKSNQDVYAKVEYSPEFTLSSEDVEIINTSAAVTLSGSATGIVEISLKQAGVWSAWMPMASAVLST